MAAETDMGLVFKNVAPSNGETMVTPGSNTRMLMTGENPNWPLLSYAPAAKKLVPNGAFVTVKLNGGVELVPMIPKEL